mgnify:FL=1
MDTFQLNILSASSAFYEGECESLVVPTPDGKCGVLAHHSNAIAAISPGELSYTVPGEKRSPFVTSGVRLGTPAVTTRGMGPAEMKEIADCIADCIFDFEGKKDDIAARVASLTARFPLYE